MKSCAMLLLAALLTGCAMAPPAPPANHLLADQLFPPPAAAIDTEQIFAVSPAMKHYLHSDIAEQLRSKGPSRGLLEAMYTNGQLKLEYDSVMTRNAAEAFDARSGNCLSLVIMTAALARELALAVRFQSIPVVEAWSRDGNLYFINGHVNLTLSRGVAASHVLSEEYAAMTIDFMPPANGRASKPKPIGERTIVAMYLNNRAAENLARDQTTEAYWWAREALLQDPGFLAAYNTLGVIYRRHGDFELAESVFAHVLAREPRNAVAMGNLARVFEAEGRFDEASRLVMQAQALQPNRPYYYFDLGIAAMRERNFVTARDLFQREVERAAYNAEFHFWLASAHAALGELQQARSHLALAIDNSTNRRDHDVYVAKLERIKASSYRPASSADSSPASAVR